MGKVNNLWMGRREAQYKAQGTRGQKSVERAELHTPGSIA